MLKEPFSESEVMIGLVGAVGTDLEWVRNVLADHLKIIGYTVVLVRMTSDVIPALVTPKEWADGDDHGRLTSLMDAGNEARKRAGHDGILALGAAAYINATRPMSVTTPNQPQYRPKTAFIISALKRPEEVQQLRAIYPRGFYVIGVHADEQSRLDRLTQDKGIPAPLAEALMKRDRDENQVAHGQRVEDTFHLSDFFVRIGDRDPKLIKKCIRRILNLLFGDPFTTPTFDEYAMYLAFATSLHSSDLSRQVGAVVARSEQILATGANETPRTGGGPYWSSEDTLSQDLTAEQDGRDFVLGVDSNKVEQRKIINEILDKADAVGVNREALAPILEKSRIRDLTEFGRVVHAEMHALLSCARAGISAKDGTLYATTFPCHNCAKHIIAAGIKRVVFIEPYPKSMAPNFHDDSAEFGHSDTQELPASRPEKVRFEPFTGVGPRRFFELFSMALGSGYPMKRKDGTGRKREWRPEQANLRLQMLPVSYLDLELIASKMFDESRNSNPESRDGK